MKTQTGLLAVLLLLVGCSEAEVAEPTPTSLANASSTSSTDGPHVADTPPDTSGGALIDTDLISPVLQFQTQGLSSDELHNEGQRVLASCMQQRGWTFEPILQNSPVPTPRSVGELREFTYTYGYGMFTASDFHDSSAREAGHRNFSFYESLGADEQERYRQDLNGDLTSEGDEPVEGSCEQLAEAAVRLPGNDQAVMTEQRNLYQAAYQSPDWLRAVDAWQECLSDQGYDIDGDEHPMDMLMTRAEAEIPLEELAELEIGVAVADFECRLETTLPVAIRLETEIVRALVERYPEWGS